MALHSACKASPHRCQHLQCACKPKISPPRCTAPLAHTSTYRPHAGLPVLLASQQHTAWYAQQPAGRRCTHHMAGRAACRTRACASLQTGSACAGRHACSSTAVPGLARAALHSTAQASVQRHQAMAAAQQVLGDLVCCSFSSAYWCEHGVHCSEPYPRTEPLTMPPCRQAPSTSPPPDKPTSTPPPWAAPSPAPCW